MGSANAARALMYPGLSPRAKLVLTRMALVAMDTDNPPRYFAGWELLALTLDRDVSVEDPAARDVAKKAVQRVVAELRKSGAITSHGFARQGHRAEYHLHLDPDSRGSQRDPLTNGRAANRGSFRDPLRGSPSDPLQGVVSRPPRGSPSDPPTTRDFKSSLPESLPGTGQATTSLVTAGEDETEYEYTRARKKLDRLGERQHSLIAAVMEESPELTVQEAAIRAARKFEEVA